MTTIEPRNPDVLIRSLREGDLAAADQIMRVAFGTFLGAPEPAAFFGDASWVSHRWKADPESAFAAEVDGEVVGSALGSIWGSFAVLGPLMVRPDLWNSGIGGRLIEPVLDRFSRQQVRLAGLFTFPDSPKHVGLYQKYGFHPRCLTALMARDVGSTSGEFQWSRYSQLSENERSAALESCRSLTDALFAGLDLSVEVRSIQAQGLGDTMLLWDDSKLAGFAACHCGPGTEAGSGACYIKFAAVQPGGSESRYFGELLTACDNYAASNGAARVLTGVNTARQEAYEEMQQLGFRTRALGIAMHRPNEAGFSRPGVYVLDDWR
jgi:predicted N-acetyltransferase YhbS